jgi:hypothetical protein
MVPRGARLLVVWGMLTTSPCAVQMLMMSEQQHHSTSAEAVMALRMHWDISGTNGNFSAVTHY